MKSDYLMPWFERQSIDVRREIFPIQSIESLAEQWRYSSISFRNQMYYKYN